MVSMNVFEFGRLCLERKLQKVKIFDVDRHEILFEGTLDEVPRAISKMEVESFDALIEPTEVMTINVGSN